MSENEIYRLHAIGVVRFALHTPDDAPMQGFEGTPDAGVRIYPEFIDTLDGIAAGCKSINSSTK